MPEILKRDLKGVFSQWSDEYLAEVQRILSAVRENREIPKTPTSTQSPRVTRNSRF